MFKTIKKELIQNPDILCEVLTDFDFSTPCIRNSEIRCGLEEGRNPTAISIRLINNDNLYVKDFVRSFSGDLFSYIIKYKGYELRDVLNIIKRKLGIDDFYSFETARTAFGGFYDKIKKQDTYSCSKVYPENTLDEFIKCYNERFLRDNISLETQKYFELGIDVLSQRITIPIRNPYGELIGVKGRLNYDSDDEPKYLYIVRCLVSSTLFGYSQNYQYILNADTIYIGESEKFVMQLHSLGIQNCVAIGGSSLSKYQCKLLMECNPKRIVFLLDKSLDRSETIANVKRLSAFTKMKDIKVYWWNWLKNTSLPDKSSPSDYGKEVFDYIISNEVEEVNLNG